MSSVSSLQSFASQTVPNSPDNPGTLRKSVQEEDMLELPSYHPKFYIAEGMATFLVENRIFRIHHHFLVRESESFKTIIMRPRDPVDSDIPLPGVTCLEFESLLDFFYNGMHEDYDPDIHEWVAILSISTRFGMEKIRQRAISHIDQDFEMDTIEKVVLANNHDIEEWLAPAYAALCQRAKPLEVWEAEKLGLVTAVKLAQVREEIRESARAAQNPVDESAVCQPTRTYHDYDTCGNCSRVQAAKDLAEDAQANQNRTLGAVNRVFWPKSNGLGSPEDTGTRDKRVVGLKRGKVTMR